MNEKRCKNATIGKCPDDECPHFWKHEKRYDCYLCCNSFLEDDTPCESVKSEPIEPQQPVEGELAPNPRPDNLSEVELKFPDFDQGILIGAQDGFDKGSKAQLAHMIQQGWVKLPSKDELLKIRCSICANEDDGPCTGFPCDLCEIFVGSMMELLRER